MKIKKLCAGLFALGMAFSLMLPTPVRAAEAASGITTNAVPGWPQGADITSTAAVVMFKAAANAAAAAAQNQDEPNDISAASCPASAPASTVTTAVCCRYITHVRSSAKD